MYDFAIQQLTIAFIYATVLAFVTENTMSTISMHQQFIFK